MENTNRVIRKRDLTDPKAFLMCVECAGEYSANPSDYFMMDANDVFTCCDRPMRLMSKKTVYSEVSK